MIPVRSQVFSIPLFRKGEQVYVTLDYFSPIPKTSAEIQTNPLSLSQSCRALATVIITTCLTAAEKGKHPK